MEEFIRGLDIKYEYVHRVSYTGLKILEDALHVLERRCCVIWYLEEESRKGPIGHTILQVENDRSDGVCYLLGAHGGITVHDRRGCMLVSAATD